MNATDATKVAILQQAMCSGKLTSEQQVLAWAEINAIIAHAHMRRRPWWRFWWR